MSDIRSSVPRMAAIQRRFIRWSPRAVANADVVVANLNRDVVASGPSVGIHLRGLQSAIGCTGSEALESSFQCPDVVWAPEHCDPNASTIVARVLQVEREAGVQFASLFISHDRRLDQQAEPVRAAFEARGVRVLVDSDKDGGSAWNPSGIVSVTVLTSLHSFVGNCASSYTGMVVRQRAAEGQSSSFF